MKSPAPDGAARNFVWSGAFVDAPFRFIDYSPRRSRIIRESGI